MPSGTIGVGTAGWTVPRESTADFPHAGSHLERYAARLPVVEINSSFYRSHQLTTYERWAASTPDVFRFSVKLPKTVTHVHKLRRAMPLVDDFLAEARGLGEKLGCLLIQLPPSLAYDARTFGRFATELRERHDGPLALEPRHASWFTPAVDRALSRWQVARVLADPVRHGPGAFPGGWQGLVYLRLHGSPRTYWSSYDAALLRALAQRLALARSQGGDCWCVFDNTASGAATSNAMALQRLLHPS